MPDPDNFARNLLWFELAVPTPTEKNFQTQLGVHFEEVAEMILPIKGHDRLTQAMLTQAMVACHALAMHLKTSKRIGVSVPQGARTEFLDAICDQAVTGPGVGHMLGFNMNDAMTEVLDSNFSKFEDGKPVFDENQKVAKGKNYFTPALDQYAV